ncbi:prolyl oligopeptidase [Sphingomonas melonis TY]|jgi:prolyl oligopeptidase|nr:MULTISPECIES: prolyl oligopeptidase family serine peptidase [Sphingomonas]AOW23585.1 S9 family peptidase [Sphingomonas melonis TY]ATI54583.1 S9 family peptidase [Sphingomonas melonis]KZB97032.1 prolyl oligopeptidase [Sphingomonas melonis TY]MBI0531052.1 S9 family peptidase [Sphingomonas sp. TX0522]MBX8844643.1 S9 family peptidase [Sphingomonas melonis]
MIVRTLLIASTMLAATSAFAQSTPVTDTDPYIWLEDKDGAKPLAWVEAENARTLPRLQNDPRYKGFYADALAIASAKDRIPMPNQLFGRIYNFWRDADHPQGIWRWTSEADYAAPQPKWTVALDLDALSKAEGKKWVWKGASCLHPEERLCLVALSEGGEDAISYREFDLATGQFVPGGFSLPKSKQGASWLDKDTLLVSRDWGAGTMTGSSYPFVVKMVKRGQPLDAAKEIFRGAPTDQLGTYAGVITDGQGHRLVTIERRTTFFGGETHVWTPEGTKKLDIPARTFPAGMVAGQVLFQTSDPWGAVAAGSVASAPLAMVESGRVTPTILFAPNPRQSVDEVVTTKDHVVLIYNDNVRGRAAVYTPGKAGWTARPIALPDNVSLGVASADDRSDHGYMTVTGFLTPTTLLPLDAATASVGKPVKTLPPKFDSAGLVVEQHEATSTDGTKVPYFIVHHKDIPLNGSTPTIMTAYGGFELPMLPAYSAITGKLWLERGGSYVLANIRGGGEFGPAWHDAGRKTKRQIIYDDFASVAKALFARKLTSPQELGIYGGSNGGLLMGVEFNQHPDLWKAVTIQVPLLDMMRYEQIEAGKSWVDEYGSVDVPAEKAFLRTISPYQNIKKGVAYPEPYIWTTTKDDRVGPQHARKFAARLKEYGLPYLFYEDTAGGHSGDADIEQGARLQALQMTYFAQKLMGPAQPAK